MSLKALSVNEVSKVKEQKKSRRLLKDMAKVWQLYVLMALPFAYIIIFKYIPMYGAQIAFKNFIATKGIWGSPWIGFDNFTRFFDSYEFWNIMGNTIGLSFYQLAAGFPFPIILALSLNYIMHERFKKMVQMVTYAPHFISVVVMVGIIFQVLDPRIGIVSEMLRALGLGSINLMGQSEYFKSIYVWSGVWQNVGFSCIIYLAALAGIDPALHEAAVVDGATKVRRMWHIDLPGILPIAMILLILEVGRMLEIGFEKAFLMQNPLNLQASEIIDTFVYKVGLASTVVNFSYSSAIGLFKNIINLILLLAVNRLAKKMGQSSLW
ncbi:ABC transporter permease [Paenibacillus agricola]|uniref:Sugar ABC transporter permease n=1 Tax=Paenibacillus agricola TaxID=2716264 RepID=A0ABX0JFE1_9BACL|nr:ABC transporter permease subunit [Paenibacillus agricola]NHN33979.1 sugar ABC transporter permease [Paenibacillus agricola]